MEQTLTKYEQEKRAQRLLAALRCAVECTEAAVFYVNKNRQLLGHHNLSKVRPTMRNVRRWTQRIVSVEQDIKANLLTLLYTPTPIISIRSLPNRFEVADLLYHIGYYPQRDDYPFQQQPRPDSIESLISKEILLEAYCDQIFLALVQAEYEGAWQPYGSRISDLYMSQPQSISLRLNVLYNIFSAHLQRKSVNNK